MDGIEDFIYKAYKAGFKVGASGVNQVYHPTENIKEGFIDELMNFAELIAKDERDACVLICEQVRRTGLTDDVASMCARNIMMRS